MFVFSEKDNVFTDCRLHLFDKMNENSQWFNTTIKNIWNLHYSFNEIDEFIGSPTNKSVALLRQFGIGGA